MTFCTSCGMAAAPGASFCSGCGRSLQVAPAAPVAGAWSPASPPVPRGPVGRTVDASTVLLLGLVTLGLYLPFYFWRISKEMDAFTGRPGHAHGKVRLGIFLLLGAIVAMVLVFVLMATLLVAPGGEGPAAASVMPVSTAITLILLTALGSVGVTVASTVLLYVGVYRVWKGIEEDERRRAAPDPISPGLMLFFFLMPYVNIVTMWIGLHRTQKGLNGVWRAATSPP